MILPCVLALSDIKRKVPPSIAKMPETAARLRRFGPTGALRFGGFNGLPKPVRPAASDFVKWSARDPMH